MVKFVIKITRHKSKAGAVSPQAEIAGDFSVIEQNVRPWADVGPPEVELVRSVLSRFSRPAKMVDAEHFTKQPHAAT